MNQVGKLFVMTVVFLNKHVSNHHKQSNQNKGPVPIVQSLVYRERVDEERASYINHQGHTPVKVMGLPL